MAQVFQSREYIKSKTLAIKPNVSFIIFSYNNEKYIQQCLDSVVNQTYHDFELIIADDGSQDSSIEIIKKFIETTPIISVAAISTKNKGINANYNNALALVRGEYICHIASDDFNYLNRIEISLKEIIKKDVSMIIGGVKLIDEKNRLIKFGNVDNSIQNINYVLSSGKIHVTSPTMFYSTELIKKYGDLSININNEDEILAFRALNEKGIFVLEEYLVSYRKHTGSITFKQTKGSFKKYINWLLDNDLQNQVNNKTDWLSVSRFRGQNIDIENKIDLLIRKILIQRENLKYLRELNNFSFWWCAFFKLKYRIHLQDYLIEMVRPIYYKTRVYLNKVLHRGLE